MPRFLPPPPSETSSEPAKLSYLRARLIQKGTLFTDGRSLRFLVPGMARRIARGDDD